MGERNRLGVLGDLGRSLVGKGYAVALTGAGLRVADLRARGCCTRSGHPGVTVLCRKRRPDGRLEFWTGWGERLGTADEIEPVAEAVARRLTRR